MNTQNTLSSEWVRWTSRWAGGEGAPTGVRGETERRSAKASATHTQENAEPTAEMPAGNRLKTNQKLLKSGKKLDSEGTATGNRIERKRRGSNIMYRPTVLATVRTKSIKHFRHQSIGRTDRSRLTPVTCSPYVVQWVARRNIDAAVGDLLRRLRRCAAQEVCLAPRARCEGTPGPASARRLQRVRASALSASADGDATRSAKRGQRTAGRA